tara:strand:- start:64 stop:549 length:486 start_codon:yes stop_codon:yes gene_type:complete
VIVGIDNGLDGGLVSVAVHDGSVISKMVMPTKQRSGKREVDVIKVYDWIVDHNTPFTLAIEEPLRHARSSQAVRSMALSFGKILGMAESRGWDVECVEVRNWQKALLGKFIPKGQTKSRALEVADELVPGECWRKSSRAKKPHDGLIDAFLIARYVRGAKA